MTPIPSSPVQAQRGTDERERPLGDMTLERALSLAETAKVLRGTTCDGSQGRALVLLAEQLRARDEEIAALRKDAERWAVVAAAARRGNFGEWVIFPDEPHDRGDVKAQFVLDIDAALQENPK